MKARSYAAVLAVLALAAAGAFLISDGGSSYADAAADKEDDAGNIHWNLTGGVLTLTLIDPNGAKETGPYGAGGAPWYDYRADVARVVIGAGITSIGDNVFYDFVALSSISIPDSVTSIGGYAFYNCVALSSISIPGKVTSIGESAFRCSSLTSVTIPDSVITIGEYAFSFINALKSVTIGAGVTKIGASAFYADVSLPSVTIPDTVAEIGVAAFAECKALTSIVIPASVQTIGISAFSGCVALRNIVFEGAKPSLGDRAFELGRAEWDVPISASLPETAATLYVWASWTSAANIDADFGAAKSANTTLTYRGDAYDPSNPNLPGGASENELGINSGVHWVYDAEYRTLTFSGTGDISYDTSSWNALRPYVQKVVIAGDTGNSITIGDHAFYHCGSLKEIVIPEGVESIGAYAFYYCSSLKEVGLPDSLKYIKEYAFKDCRTLASIVIPGNVTEIGNNAFYRCYSLVTVEIKGAADIGDLAFHGCYALASVTFSGDLHSIGERAFNRNLALRSIVIPASVTLVGDSAFRECLSLASAAVLATNLDALPNNVFVLDASLLAVSIHYDGEAINHTSYNLPAALALLGNTQNSKVLLVYYVDAVGGPVYATQSLLGWVTLSGIDDAAKIGTSWSDGGYVLTALDGTRFSAGRLASASTIYAYEPGVFHVIAASIANGTITPSGDVSVVGGAIRAAQNGDATFGFVANAGYAIKSVAIDGSKTSDEALAALAAGTYTFEDVTGVHAIAVETERTELVVAASADANSTITPSGSVGVVRGGSVTFTFSASAGYAISDVVVDGASVPSAASAGKYTFSGVDSNHAISVKSAPSASSPAGSGNSDGSGSGSGSGSDGANDGAGDSRA
ncbi:MAG: leucine-rich repeat domain-containing protein, partial [Candidatus Methanoplasma sp.]|nr:leucine-rich repeat domain-containing protein [Candidatus Methanoplasma sp.]